MNFNINQFKADWISEGLDESAVQFADSFGLYLCDKKSENDRFPGRMAMTTSQIRNVFGEIKRIQARGYEKEKSNFLLLRPKIAYAEARALAKSNKSRVSDFRKVLDQAHMAVKNEKQFQNFVDFMEAVLAYHKAYGARD